jgi:hypothetical protein
MLQQPVMWVPRHPLDAFRQEDAILVPVGVPIERLRPDGVVFHMCRVNGEWLLEESRQSLTRPGDIIEWHPPGETFRTILAVVSAVVSIIFPVAAPWMAALNVAYNLLVPPIPPKMPVYPSETEDAYSTSVAGNVARIDQPIWRNCGHVEITPSFACEPYYEYLPKPGAANPNLDRDQYYYALFAVGVGNHDVIPKIANTPLSRFRDVTVARYLPPGTLPTVVNTNVTTAVEVSSMTLEDGRYVGGFAACVPRHTCDAVGIDVMATRGLGKADQPLTVRWQVEWRAIDDFGRSLTQWAILATEERTAFTSTPQRWSSKYTLPAGVRPEIRLSRIPPLKDSNPNALHEIAWTALRAYRTGQATLNPNVAHFELVMRASSQLGNQSSQDVRLICDSYVRTWHPDTGWSEEEVKTRNPMWWVLDLITSPIWGIGQPDSRIDLQSFYDIAQTCEERQDRFDFTFMEKMGAWEAAQLIARVCRSRVFRRSPSGVISIARDEAVTAPLCAFSPRNCRPDSIAITETTRRETSADGIIVQYRDRRTGVWDEILCPVPGLTDEEVENPTFLRLDGVVGAIQAEREGRYEAASLLYRTRNASLTTEMEGTLPAYLSPVRVQPQIANDMQSGDVAFWDVDTLTMGLSEPVDFSEAPIYLVLQRDDGTLTTAVQVQPGPSQYDVVLPAEPDFEMRLDDGMRERPKYFLGPAGRELIVKVREIADAGVDHGVRWHDVTGVVDDPRVHTYDSHLLPGPGDIQDPIDYPDNEPGGTYFPTVYFPPEDQYGPDWPNFEGMYMPSEQLKTTRIIMRNNGSMNWFEQDFQGVTIDWEFPKSWLIGQPVDVTYAARYEVKVDIQYGYSPPGADNYVLSGDFGVWVPLDTTRTWQLEIGPMNEGGFGGFDPDSWGGASFGCHFTVRNRESLVVQDEWDYTFRGANWASGDGGGGDGGGGA